MSFGDTSKSRIAFIAESTFGTTPATPTFKEIRRSGGGMELNKGTVVSQQISLVRDIRSEIQTSQDVRGNIPFEFSNANFDDLLQAATGGTWATNVLKSGNTFRSLTIEETIPVGATSNYHRFLGCSVNTLGINIPARGLLTGELGFMGKSMGATATAIISGATYTAPNEEGVFSADLVTGLTVLGASPIVSNLSLNLSNNLRLRPSVGSLYTDEFGMGAFEVTGRLEAYFADNDIIDAILGHDTTALEFTVGVDTNKKYTFEFPLVQIGNGTTNKGGQSDDVMVNFDFRAVYDSGESSSLKITRLVA